MSLAGFALKSAATSFCRQIFRYSATDVPIIQLCLSSNSMSDAADLAIVRPSSAAPRSPRRTAASPVSRLADFDQEALQSRGPAPADVADALTRPNVILPA